jgi:hypothetical protein
MYPSLRELLLERLSRQGMELDDAPALVRDLSNILELNPGIDPATASSKLQLLGWSGLTLDYQSLQLALAWMEFGNKKGDLE